MKLIAPEGYTDFACTAGQCRHTCCAGWEIDIDPATQAAYRAMPGKMGDRLRQSIDWTEDGASFHLTENERCPMLRDDGLCDVICKLGQDALCQICTDHPRFRHFYADRVEIGLGFCCEEAARMQLARTLPFRLSVLENDGLPGEPNAQEQAFFHWRDTLMAAAVMRTLTLETRMTRIMQLAGLSSLPAVQETARFCLTLEQLDDAWTQQLTNFVAISSAPRALPSSLDIPAEQLLCYLLYRHLPDALEDGQPLAQLALCLALWQLCLALCAAHSAPSLAVLTDLARMMSAEIEYSQENLDALALWAER